MKNLGILIIDMQENFLKLVGEKEKLIRNQIRLLELTKEDQIPVFTLEYKNRGGELIQELKKPLGERGSYFISKVHCDGFKNNPVLISTLERWRIKNLILTGVYAGACVLQTAKGAKKEGIKVFTSDMLMNKRYESDTHWYQQNTDYSETLAGLLTKISNPNL